jgi:hypothetical protein
MLLIVLRINVIISLNRINRFVTIMEMQSNIFDAGMNGVSKYYLDKRFVLKSQQYLSQCMAGYCGGLCLSCCQCMRYLWWMVRYWDRIFVQVLKFLTGSIILSMFHAHFHRHATVIRRTSKQSLGTFKQGLTVLVSGQHLTEVCFHIDTCFDSLDHRLPSANFYLHS